MGVAEMYVEFIKMGIKTIDDVPERKKELVKQLLEQEGKDEDNK